MFECLQVRILFFFIFQKEGTVTSINVNEELNEVGIYDSHDLIYFP